MPLAALKLCPSTPTLARPVLFHENSSLINPVYILTDLLICNFLLCLQKELSFSCNNPPTQKGAGSIPGQGTCLGCGSVPVPVCVCLCVCMREKQSIDVSLPPFLLSFPSKNK